MEKIVLIGRGCLIDGSEHKFIAVELADGRVLELHLHPGQFEGLLRMMFAERNHSGPILPSLAAVAAARRN